MNLKDFMEEFEIESLEAARDALCDGEFLGSIGMSQEEAEELHDLCEKSQILDDLDNAKIEETTNE